MRGHRRIENIGLLVCLPACELDDRFAIRSFARTGLDWLPIFPLQCGNEKCGEKRFSDVGIGAGYKQIRTHPDTTSISRAATSALRKRSISAIERLALREMRMRDVPTGTVGGRI